MKNERLFWILGITGAVAAAAGITYAATKSPSTPQQPPPPNKPPFNPSWQPTSSVTPGKKYRISVPGDPTTTAVITKLLANSNVGQIYLQGGTPLPADWPKDDSPDPTRWRAEFVSPVPVLMPPGVDVKLWVYQLGA